MRVTRQSCGMIKMPRLLAPAAWATQLAPLPTPLLKDEATLRRGRLPCAADADLQGRIYGRDRAWL
jgi:hypothetical protein